MTADWGQVWRRYCYSQIWSPSQIFSVYSLQSRILIFFNILIEIIFIESGSKILIIIIIVYLYYGSGG